jgi:hypothetical protein
MDDKAIGSVPLGAAIKEWSDPELLDAMLKAEDYSRRFPGKAGSEAIVAKTMVELAQKAFLDDVRWRIEIGVILLTGVQTQPEPQTARTAIPGEWATAMQFDIPNRAVTCFGYRWIAVRGTLAIASTPDAAPAPPTTDSPEDRVTSPVEEVSGTINADVAAADADHDPVDLEASLEDVGVRRGREAFLELIMDALRAHYGDTADLSPAPVHGWSALAPRILNVLQHQHPTRHAAGKLPMIGTIRTRLPQLYSRLLQERRVQK